MKLRNKKTGEIGCLQCSFGKTPEKITVVQYIDGKRGSKVWYYDTLAELTEDWEDYEEPKKGWYLSSLGLTIENAFGDDGFRKRLESICNYFETEEEAEKAVEKLKALKRLRDKGFKFTGFSEGEIKFKLDEEYSEFTYKGYDEGCEFYLNDEVDRDLTCLFGGEE